jgi:hypothetical protein
MPCLSFPSSSSKYIFHFTIEWKKHFPVSNFEVWLLVLQSDCDVAIVSFCQLHVVVVVVVHVHNTQKEASSSSSSSLKFFSTFLPLLSVPLYILSSSIQFVTVRIAADLESRIMTRSPRQQSQPRRRRRDTTQTHTRRVAHCCM